MNPVMKVENEDNFHKFNYLKDEEGVFEDYSTFFSSNPLEFDSVDDPWLNDLILPDDHIVSGLSLEDIKEITRYLDADLSIPTQGNDSSLLDAKWSNTDTIYETLPALEQQPNHQNVLVDAKPIYSTTTTSELIQYVHDHDHNVVDAKPIYSITNDLGCHLMSNVVTKEMILTNDIYNFSLLSCSDDHVLVDEIKSTTTYDESDKCLIHFSAHDNDFGIDDDDKKDAVVHKKQVGKSKTSALEFDEIRKYFEMPITQAAKELNVGLTVLKKRCRELNIMRWPHRKIKSLNCLIHNVRENGITNENEIKMLEEHKRMLEIVPELELTERTKRLRQFCFKANYKRRRLQLANA